MNQKLKIFTLVIVIVVIAAGYNYSGQKLKRKIGRRIAELGQTILKSQRWYRHEYIVSGKLLDQAKREALVKRLDRELQENLNSFKNDVTDRYKQVQSVPAAYKLIDDVIQDLGKRLGLVKESGSE